MVEPDDDVDEDVLGRRQKRNIHKLPESRLKEIPPFELSDIQGEFSWDPNGNFIILKNEKNTGLLEDRFGRRVNPRGYLIDRLGNVITKEGVLIFYVNELDPSGEIPYPFNESLRKPHMENAEGAKYSLNEIEMMHGNQIGVTRKIGRLQDEDQMERKLGEGLDETPPGSDIENNPGEFLKEISPLKGQGVFDFKRPKPIVPTLNKDLEAKDFSKLTNEELQYMLSLMNEQYI